MKKLAILFVLFLSSVVAFAQTSATAPFKKANIIIITAPDSGEVAWKKAAQVMLANGFTIKHSDATLGTLSTEQKNIKSRVIVALSASIQGRTIVLNGTMVTPALSTLSSPIDYRGMSNSPALLAWQEMEKVAKSYPAAQISYQKKD